MKNNLVVCFIPLIFALTCAVDKKWMRDTNFDNPLNWHPEKVPCGNDHVFFPTTTPVIYVNVNTTIKEMNLPVNGELIFGNDMNIGFTDQVASNCQSSGEEVDFEAVHPESWLNPNNWCTSSNSTKGGCDQTTTVLDVERVPCTYDTVLFPSYHMYYVDLTEKFSVSLRSVKYQRALFSSTDDLVKYFKSQDGRQVFQTEDGASPITIDRNLRCKFNTGCPCGNDKPEIAKLICPYVQCNRPRCQNVIKPVGACCNLCGVVFNITAGDGFVLRKFTTDIRNQFLQSGTDNSVSLATSITTDNWIQLVLTDTKGDKSLAVGKEIETELLRDIHDGGHKYNVDTFTMSAGSPAKAQQSMTALHTNEIAGIVAAVLLLLLAAAVITFVVIKGRCRGISMPKLPRFSRRGPRPTAFVTPHTAPHVDPGFANPLYGATPLDDENVVFREMKVMGLSDDVATFDVSDKGFQNPMFGVQQLRNAALDDVAVTSSSGSPLAINIKHQPKDSTI